MTDRKTRKLIIVIVPILCVFMIALSVYARNQADLDTRASAATDVDEEVVRINEDSSIKGVPRVVSADPISVPEGEEFTYFLEIVDSDTPADDITVIPNEIPNWMEVDPDNFILSGIPRIGATDTQKVSVFISDGTNQVEHNFFLLILPENE